MIASIISWLSAIVISVISALGYGGVFFLMLIESCGILAPSEVTMPFAGYLATQGRFNFWAVVLLGALGNLAGSLIAYWIGYKGGRPLIARFGKYIFLSDHDLKLAEDWFTRYGQATAFFGRLLPVIRTYISFPAGLAKMDLKKFSVFTFLGAFIWSALFAWLGEKLGSNFMELREKLHGFDMTIAFILAFGIIFFVWKKWDAKKRASLR
jgi:membrane protein DedA with SNARE-associated domain